jgi:hypothetical protein
MNKIMYRWGMGRCAKPKSPLGSWLQEMQMGQAVFARVLGAVRGAAVDQSQISKWASGAVTPNKTTRAAIAAATRGAVPPESWESKS